MAVDLQSPLILIKQFNNLEISKFEAEQPFKTPHSKLIHIRRITPADSDAVLEHLRKYFFRDEPLNLAVKLIEFPDSTCVELEEYSLKSIKEGHSAMAVTPCGKIVGVCLNGLMNGKDPVEEESEECNNPKFAQILELLDYCGKEGTNAVLQKFPEAESVMFVKILSTDTEWRGMGIARELLEYTSIGREQGCNLMRVDCTSYFSARAIARIGFERAYELNYDDYKKNGMPVFVTELPHSSFTVYVQKIR
ncbi:dopamine N-acetyltransferase-like isoform X2 [Photinus pyralis]|uniref:dopamine N-acetyltransferase-like isoform X2 n=1 Tax=Photinus pyralis TaxID=7054 RepID=UPI0012671D8C|nr:dopamine N-acetyltransferase-like isoform X2 [Photinus pyralis]